MILEVALYYCYDIMYYYIMMLPSLYHYCYITIIMV